MLESVRKAHELMAITGLSRDGAADALRANGGDVLKALAALIESGEVTAAKLRRDLCPPELAAAAEAKAAAANAAADQRDRELAAFASDPARPEFPSLAQDEHGEWTAKDVFPFWKDFYVAFRYGQSVPDDREPEEKHGIFPVRVNGDEESEDGVVEGWTEPQRRAYSYLKQNERAVGQAVLDALFRLYRDEILPRREDWFSYTMDPERLERALPTITSPEEMRRLISFDDLFVWYRSKDGVAYTGFTFSCVWDSEHGAGVVMHQNRVVEIGDASTAFDESQLDEGA